MTINRNIDAIPHVALKRVINIELSADELNILLNAICWRDREMMPRTTQIGRLYRKLYEARKLARGEYIRYDD
nr:MAG TPA: hypothetical protein [Caudoviricetes sp.]